MIKPDSLRAAITTSIPDLARDADRLAMWADKGRITSSNDGSRSFAWAYTLNIVITDLTTHPSVVFLIINDWLAQQQPDLLSPGSSGGYQFEADILGTDSFDLQIALELTENVVLRPRAGGGFDLEHLAEPFPLLDDLVPLTDPVVLLRQIFKDGERIVPLDPLLP
jgi:hypothetical protein